MLDAWIENQVLKRVAAGAVTLFAAYVTAHSPRISADFEAAGILFIFKVQDPAKLQIWLTGGLFLVLTEIRHAIAERWPSLGRLIA
jgi:hypothetical protein